MLYDHKYAGLDTSNIIEFQDNKSVLNEIQKCLLIVFEGSFAAAKSNHQTIGKTTNYSFVYRLSRDGIKQLDFLLPMKIIKRSTKRNGFHFILFLYLIKAYIKLPFHLIKRGLVLLKNVK
jgi:hypothetical protein